MKYKLPVVLEQTVREAEVRRQLVETEFTSQLQAYLSDEKEHLSCAKGCTNCCYYPLMVSALEGVSLFRWLTEHHRWSRTLRDKFVAAHRMVWGMSASVWMLSLIPCPLLGDDKLCQAYEGRPTMCRATVSVRSPELCHPHEFGAGNTYLPFRRETEEALHQAETDPLRRAHFTAVRMPLATAVLMGEYLCKEDKQPEDITAKLFEEWVKNA